MENNYNDRVQMMARMWEYKFSQSMTKEDHLEFRKDCKSADVDTMDVMAEMEDFGCI